ncbi:MAG: OmpA family protein [Saprospiraceae bacterium]
MADRMVAQSDKDNDGVEDADDLCPDVAATAKAKGCPDRDGDGFGDSFDKCPDEVGTREGCPDLTDKEKEFLRFAAKNIYFDTGKATLQSQSYITLNGVADILLKYPRYHLQIGGHTDNVGNDENNRILSEERAKSCYEFMLSRSLSKDRMTYKGYGETQPVADNKTEAGREANRRVEFTVFLP